MVCSTSTQDVTSEMHKWALAHTNNQNSLSWLVYSLSLGPGYAFLTLGVLSVVENDKRVSERGLVLSSL